MNIPENLHAYTRGYLPHYHAAFAPTSVTFRLKDSLPRRMLVAWEEECRAVTKTARTAEQEARAERIEEYLDKGNGLAFLQDERLAAVVQNSLLYFAGDRYLLHGWAIMPNHVHVMLTPTSDIEVSAIVHSWKSYSANEINRIREVSGAVWQREYYDRLIRDERHFCSSLEYIERNPVKAGLCTNPTDWPFSSASFDAESRLRIGIE